MAKKLLIGLAFLCFLSVFSSAQVAPVQVSIPNTSGASGSIVEIPINVDNGTGIAGFQFTITFNNNVLQATGVTAGSLTSGWSISSNTTVPGQIIIAGFDLSLNGISGGSGSLCIMRFNVVGNSGQSTSLTFTQCLLTNNLGQSIPSTPNDGTFTVSGQVTPGSFSGSISYGGQKTGTIYVGLFSSDDYSGSPLFSTSINSPGSYTISNVSPGTYYVAAFRDSNTNGKYDPLEDPAGFYQQNPITISQGENKTGININLIDPPTPPTTRNVSIPENLGATPGAFAQIPINIDDGRGIASFTFTITFGNTDFFDTTSGKVENGDLLPEDWACTLKYVQNGVEIKGSGVFNTVIAEQGGTLAILKLKVKDNVQTGVSTTLDFSSENSSLKNSENVPIDANYVGGNFKVLSPIVLKSGGWNLISFPVNPSLSKPRDLFGAKLLSIYEWNASSQSYNFVNTLVAKKGYWVAVSEDINLKFSGIFPASPAVNLLQGWNLIGPIENKEKPSGNNILGVYGWQGPPDNQYIIPQNCQVGQGYWIAVPAQTTIWEEND